MNIDKYNEYLNEKVFSMREKNLFRYRSGIYNDDGTCYSVEALKNNEIWFSAASTMDDVFDCNIPISREEVLPSFVKYFSDVTPEFQERVFNSLYEDVNKYNNRQKGTYLSCFSTNSNSSIMWNYYANAHEGFCIEYDYELIYKHVTERFEEIKDKGEVIFLSPVIYNESPIIEGLINAHQVTIKSNEWEFEDEWRIVYSQNNRSQDENKKYIPLEFKTIKPKAIYIGYKIQNNSRLYDELYCYCLENKIAFKKKELKENNFGFQDLDILI